MYRLVYLSVARGDLRWSDIDAICTIARERNEELGVTGLLLHDGSRFLQVMEGDRLAVLALMGRISIDPRHSGITIVSQGMVDRRIFGDWEMACQEVTTLEDARSFLVNVSAIAVKIRDDSLADTLRTFANGPVARFDRGMPPPSMAPVIAALALQQAEAAQPAFSNAAVMMTVTSSETSGTP